MPRVAYPNEVGISDPDIIEVRISTAKKRGKSTRKMPTDHILKVRHRIFGWLTSWEWGMLAKIEGFVERIDPLSVAAWVGFTLAYKGGIDSAQAFGDWLGKAAGEAAGTLADFSLWWASGISQVFGQGPLPDISTAGISEIVPFAGGLTGFFESVGKFLFPVGEISEWFWAATAAAISVLALKRGLTP